MVHHFCSSLLHWSRLFAVEISTRLCIVSRKPTSFWIDGSEFWDRPLRCQLHPEELLDLSVRIHAGLGGRWVCLQAHLSQRVHHGVAAHEANMPTLQTQPLWAGRSRHWCFLTALYIDYVNQIATQETPIEHPMVLERQWQGPGEHRYGGCNRWIAYSAREGVIREAYASAEIFWSRATVLLQDVRHEG